MSYDSNHPLFRADPVRGASSHAVWLSLFLTLTLFSPTLAQPATQPAKPQLITQSLRGLSAPDPAARARSRDALLGLSRDDLPLLRDAVQQQRQLDPSQASALKDIVIHVFLAGDEYRATAEGFLGITMSRPDHNGGFEVVIDRRMPGFCAFRALQDGDAVLDIEERPLPQPVNQEVFKTMLRQFKAGQTVHLKVLRHGQLVRVPVKLDPRPADSDDLYLQDMLVRRAQESEAYWRKNFAPLLGESSQTQPVGDAAP